MKSYCSLQIWVLSYVLKSLTEVVCSHQANMTVTTHAAVSFSLSFVFTRDLYNTHYIMYFMTHSFYAYLAPPIVVGVLLTCQSLNPEYKTTAFFQMYLQEKNIVLYWGQYSIWLNWPRQLHARSLCRDLIWNDTGYSALRHLCACNWRSCAPSTAPALIALNIFNALNWKNESPALTR